MKTDALIIGHGFSLPNGSGIWFLCTLLSLGALCAGVNKKEPRPLWSVYLGGTTALCGVLMMIGLLRGNWGGIFGLLVLIPIVCGAICLADERVLELIRNLLALMARNKILTASIALFITGAVTFLLLLNTPHAPESANLVAIVLIAMGVAGLILFRPRKA